MNGIQTINSHKPAPRMPVQQPAWGGQRPNDVQMSDVVMLYRTALQRLVGKRSFAAFEVLLLWSVSDAVVALSRHGIGEEDSCVALAARHALAQMDQRIEQARGPMGSLRVLPDEGAALDDMLRVHDLQLRSDGLAVLLLAQAITGTRDSSRGPVRGARGVREGRRGSAMGRKHASNPENVHG